MSKRSAFKLISLSLPLLAVFLLTVAAEAVHVTWLRHYEGLFLLHGKDGKGYQLQDDLLLGDGSRLICGIELEWLENWLREIGHSPQESYLTYEWDEEDGNGYVVSHFPGGKKLMTNFSRYDDSQGLHTKGLFVGGALPGSAREDTPARQSDTGMSWFDGERWYHLWCNTNEGISSLSSNTGSPPNRWHFLGSRVLIADSDKLVVESRHLIDIDQTTLRMTRFLYMEAGVPYAQLGILLTNTGKSPAHYSYLYADEPWVGDFGSSKGDIGWLDDGLVYQEGYVNPSRHTFAGLADQGNPLLGEHGGFTGIANFIAWAGGASPDDVFFANQYWGFRHDPAEVVPLSGNARSLGLRWRTQLPPGGSQKILLRLGLAATNPTTGLPAPPPLRPIQDLRQHGFL